MNTFIWRLLVCLNIYLIGGSCYRQGTLLKLLKQVDSKLNEIKNEENEINSIKRFAYPPLPDTPRGDYINYSPKWHGGHRNYYRPRIKLPPLPYRRELEDESSLQFENSALDDNDQNMVDDNFQPVLYTPVNKPYLNRDVPDANSIIPESYSEKVISDNDNSNVYTDNRTKELEDTLEYISNKVNRLMQDEKQESSESSDGLTLRESASEEEWSENEIPESSEGISEEDSLPELVQDLSQFTYQLNQSLDRPKDYQQASEHEDGDVDSVIKHLSRLTNRIDSLVAMSERSLPPVPLETSQTEKALPPLPYKALPSLPQRALPPLPYRALPPLPYRAVTPSPQRALPPLPYRALPPLPYRALPPLPYRSKQTLPDRALPPLPYRALPPLPYRSKQTLPDRALPPLPYREIPPLPHRAMPPLPGKALPPLPLTISKEKRQELVKRIDELSQQVEYLTELLRDEQEGDTDADSIDSRDLYFPRTISNAVDEVESEQKLVEGVTNLAEEVERLLENYKRKADYNHIDDMDDQMVDSQTQMDMIPIEKSVKAESFDFDQDSLEEDLSNLSHRAMPPLPGKALPPVPLRILDRSDNLSEASQSRDNNADLDDSQLSAYLQRVNDKVDQLLRNDESETSQLNDEIFNYVRSGQDPCQGVAVLKQKEGTIDYPSGHGQYSSFQDCRWAIMGSGNQKVRIRFTMMNIEHDSPCDDYVQVSMVDEKHLATPRKVYVRLCESSLTELPENKKEFVVDGPNVLIHFHSDWIWTARGFGLRYRIEGAEPTKPKPQPAPSPTNLPDACKGSGVTVRGEKGTIDFYNGYPDKAKCRWFISGGDDVYTIGIKVTVTALDIEPSKDCSSDKLIIASVNMQKKTFKSLKELCGSTVPRASVEVPTDDAYIVLISNAKTHGRGFRLTFEHIRKAPPPVPVTPKPTPRPPATPKPPVTPKPSGPTPKPVSPYNDPCQGKGSIIHGDKGVIDFTGGYKNNANCSWFIAADKEAHQIWVTITRVDIKGTGRKCAGDRLLVAAVLMKQNKVLPVDVICGAKVPAEPIIIASSFAYIGFRSDGSQTGDGFRLTYLASFPEHPPMTTTSAPGVSPAPKPTTPYPALPGAPDLEGLSCSFDAGTSCKWGNLKVKGDPLDWKIQVAGSNGWKNYAKVDHTSGSSTGSYAYVYANEAKPGTKGTLKSPTIKAAPGNGMCLTLWYNMFDTFGKFTVDMIPEGESEETLFVLDGSQGNAWHQAKVALVSDVPFQIYLTHTRGEKATETGLAIDDVRIENAPCLATALACGQTKYHTRREMSNSSDYERALIDLERDVDDLENFLDGSEDKNLTKRVIAGQASRHGEWPWIVHLRNFHYGMETGVYSQCGGTLIHPKWILTAAHCFEGDEGEVKKNPNNVMLYFGEHNIGYGSIEEAQFAMKPAKVILHPSRNKKASGSAAHRFDFALVELKVPVTLSEFVNVACLPDKLTPVGTKCVAAGWGATDSGDTSIHLLHITQQVINKRHCMYRVFEDQVCAISLKGYGDVCQGDSGGPLVCPQKGGRYAVIGAVSFGDKCTNRERTPGVYANVHHAMSWIQTTMRNTD